MGVGVDAIARLSNRARQLQRLWSTDGLSGITGRVRRRAAGLLAPPGSTPLEVGEAEFKAAAALADAGWRLPPPASWKPGDPLRVAWVCAPPAPGSGGHTTMFRLVDALTAAGASCTVYLVDRHGWDLSRHIERIRQGWPRMTADVRDFEDGIADAHAIFATSWDSAWTLLRSSALGLRCYLVQDFEPWFYPAGSESLLAEATYRFGFKGVTAGKWLPTILNDRCGMEAVGFDFGSDTDFYAVRDPDRPRNAICYYCRPSTPRRAHEIAMAALKLFADRNPAVPVHFYGETVADLGFPAIQHGTLSPTQLNDLYNECSAGLSLSATNVSLVPHEMLAAGCIPVVNDAPQNRIVLDNDHVVYAPATPYDLVSALERVVHRPPEARLVSVAAASASVSGRSWDSVGEDFVAIVERLVAEAAGARDGSS